MENGDGYQRQASTAQTTESEDEVSWWQLGPNTIVAAIIIIVVAWGIGTGLYKFFHH
ncbi:MAG: hypothetical protein JWN50_444 [Parcubacteria group bacterium]|nr:hypothetical protein [Parcubacteria group bacterium]